MTAAHDTAGSRAAQVAAGRGVALVVDDEPLNRLLLETLLAHEGFEVVTAADGAEAVARFEQVRPDIVFMDVMMPVLDGYEATRRIKAASGERFVPVIFLTALSDDQALPACVAAGGDDFLSKPFRRPVLRARIEAMERARDLNRRLFEQREALRVLEARRQRDEELAQAVYARALAGHRAAVPVVRQLLRPAASFSGDLLLLAPRPDGGLHVLLGDFTGHGLGAAIGALPVAELFGDLTARGLDLAALRTRIDAKLRSLLPPDMFLAACLLHVARDLAAIEIWNCGMPEALVVAVDGTVRARLRSRHLPLGIAGGAGDAGGERLAVQPGERVMLCSDGVIEARNAAGAEFGEARLIAAIETGAGDSPFERVCNALAAFCGETGQDDDVSLVEIPCRPELLAVAPAAFAVDGRSPPGRAGGWRWSIEFGAEALRGGDRLPQVAAQVREWLGGCRPPPALYTILAELYANALEHGVLGLDSAVKNSPDGFEHYYGLRAERLAGLGAGWVRIAIESLPAVAGGRLRIVVHDSGPGFDPAPYLAGDAGPAPLHGRGIRLVQSLCESLRYEDGGARVEAVYAWSDAEAGC